MNAALPFGWPTGTLERWNAGTLERCVCARSVRHVCLGPGRGGGDRGGGGLGRSAYLANPMKSSWFVLM